MKKYLYQGHEIEYSGFKMEGKSCFYFYDAMLYLTDLQISKLEKIN